MKKIIIFFILLSLVGCKPKQIIQERVVYKTDSAAVTSLRSELQKKTIELQVATTDLERTREEIIKLRSEVSQHEINYDTNAPLKPDGTYPIASETKTESKTEYEQTKKEYLKIIDELKKEVQEVTTKNINLDQEVKKITEENKELKSKTTPTTGFNFRLFGWGVLAGVVLVILAVVIKIRIS